MNQATIDELLAKARDGDRDAENCLFQHLLVRFRAFARRKVGSDDADEPVQEACVIILKKYKSEHFQVGFMPWAYGVFRRKLLNFLAGSRRHCDRNLELWDEQMAAPSQPDPLFLSALQECIERISRTSRRFAPVLALVAKGDTKRQICRKLRMSEGSFDTNYWRAREQLDECLENAGVDV